MQLVETKFLNKEHKKSIIGLWNLEYPMKLTLSTVLDFEKYLGGLSDRNHIVLMDENQNLKGWFCCFVRNGERGFVMLLDKSLHGKGWGSKILDLAKQRNDELYGWVIPDNNEIKLDGENYRSPMEFYHKNGFEVLKSSEQEKNDIVGVKVRWEKERTAKT